MRTVSLRLVDMAKAVIPIGFEGENEFTSVRIDCKKMLDQHPNAIPSMTVKDPAGNIYPAVVTLDGTIAVWNVTASDLTKRGDGEIQLSFTIDGTVVGKSDPAKTRISRSLESNGGIPEPIQNWIDEANLILGEIPVTISESVDTALAAAKESGEFDGDDGVSPVVTVEAITGGHRVTITDAEGNHPFEVLDGEDGDPGHTPVITASKSGSTTTIMVDGVAIAQISDGQEGDPGHSPVVTASKAGKVTTISVDGTPIATINDGDDGTTAIDDTAGEGDTDKVWSADKSHSLLTEIVNGKGKLNKKQDYEIAGKNLLNNQSPNNTYGYYMGSNGAGVSASNYFISDFIPVESGEDYAIKTGAGAAAYHGWYNENCELINTFSSAGNTGAVVTAPSNAKYLRVSGVKNVTYGQVEKGSAITEYEPFITKASIYGNTKNNSKGIAELTALKADEEVLGKNLLNIDSKSVLDGYYLKSDGTTSANNSYQISAFIPVDASTSYAISTGASASTYNGWYNSNFELISTFANSGTTAVVASSPSTAKYLKVTINKGASAQVEKGSSASEFEAYVTKKVIYDTALSNGIGNIIHAIRDYEHQKEVVPGSYTDNKYMNANGVEYSSTSYRYSEKIPVVPGELCEFYKSNTPAKARFITAYNSSDTVDGTKGSNDAVKTYIVPDGIASIVISVANDSDVWKVKRTPQNRVINSENVNEQVESATVRSNCLSAKSVLLANGSKIVCGQNGISNMKRLAFVGFFSSFVGVIVGHGYTSDSLGTWLEITDTKAKVYRRWDGETQMMQEYTHGLTMTNYIGVIVLAGYENKAKIVIYTNGGSYTINDTYWYGRQGEIFALANGNDFTNASISWNAPLTRKKIWAYGDSYFDTGSDRKWNYYLVQLGIHSVMWDDNSGRHSIEALESFKNDLKLGTPKYVLWCMGMNDTEPSGMNANWQACAEELIAICQEHEIIPIFATIPNTTSRRNEYKNAWVKASGYHYIDFAEAVGGSSYPSSWYSGMLLSDGVHPDVQGAIALFNQAITDFPELLDDET